ncbi:MAG TPA: HAMP domain-containing sensor histidine kinase [Sphingobacteriaceae bacterium]
MKEQELFYRKNFSLIIVFVVLTTVSFIVALYLGYNLTRKYVENEFATQKIDVLEQTVKPYNDFFSNKIPEISFYQGYLDSVSAAKYVHSVLREYPFVERILFYDTEISNHFISDGFRVNNFSMGPKAVYQFGRDIPADSAVLFKNSRPNSLSLKTADEFNKMAIRFSGYIETIDTTQAIRSEDIFNTFYSITPNRITYMNIPRREELRIYQEMMYEDGPLSAVYQHDLLSFYLNAKKLRLNNIHPELYQVITIEPLVYEPLDNNPSTISTDIPLPGAFSDYKLYFRSTTAFLRKEINSRFLPIAAGIFFIYLILSTIAYLIYRNLNINSRMYKLQYDFVNNLTHEFKTPVSVIKIAGNNIRSASQLSERERLHYGKILDEEADKLNDLMNKVLSFTQIENKAIRLKSENINLDVFCQNIIDAYQLKYPNFDISFSIQGIEYYTTDPVLLTSIFQNLIDNAYKYSPPDRKVLDIMIRKIKGTVVLRFADQGIGIHNKDLDNIFKKFYRIQSQYNQQGSVGLGLAFCKEVVNFMNGTISVRSRVGKGSEFTITLPYEK